MGPSSQDVPSSAPRHALLQLQCRGSPPGCWPHRALSLKRRRRASRSAKQRQEEMFRGQGAARRVVRSSRGSGARTTASSRPGAHLTLPAVDLWREKHVSVPQQRSRDSRGSILSVQSACGPWGTKCAAVAFLSENEGVQCFMHAFNTKRGLKWRWQQAAFVLSVFWPYRHVPSPS